MLQRWAQVSGPPRAGGSRAQDPLFGGLLLPSACIVWPLWALGPANHPTLTSLCFTALPVPGVKTKKPIQTKFRMPLLNWVALKPSQITGTVFTELNDEKVLQVSMALPCFQCGHQRRRGLAWIISSIPLDR